MVAVPCGPDCAESHPSPVAFIFMSKTLWAGLLSLLSLGNVPAPSPWQIQGWKLGFEVPKDRICSSGDSLTSPELPPPNLLGLIGSPGEEEKLFRRNWYKFSPGLMQSLCSFLGTEHSPGCCHPCCFWGAIPAGSEERSSKELLLCSWCLFLVFSLLGQLWRLCLVSSPWWPAQVSWGNWA